MNSRERILAALSLQQPDRVPFADIVDHSVKEKLMGCKAFTETEFARALGLDAVGIDDYAAPIFCRTQEAGGREYVVDGQIKSEQDMGLINFPNPNDDCFYDSVKRFVDRHATDGLARYAKCRWGIGGVLYSMGVTGLAYALYDHPGLVEKLLDRYVEWNYAVIERLNTVGLDFIIDYDNIAFKNGPLVSPQVFREVFLPRIKLVANACRLPWVFHGDGDLKMILNDLLTLGMNGIRPIQPPCMNISEMKHRYGNSVCLWGNIDLNTLACAQPEQVEAEVKQCIRDAGQNGGYILGSANSLADSCRIENIWAMARAVKFYGRYPLNLD
jgi:uroporphyrinogen decarboxylase